VSAKVATVQGPGGFERLCRALGGIERVEETGLPVEEFVHPWPLLAMAVLGVNDHVLKGSGWLPGWLTGKLSDFAGLFFFPLFLTAAVGTLLAALHRLGRGRGPDYSLAPWKLMAAIALTAVIFVPLKLSEDWGSLYIRAMQALDVLGWFGHFQVTKDPTDLVALVMFPLAYLHGRRFVRRVPLGRLRVLGARAAGTRGPARRAVLAAGTGDVRSLLRGAAAREAALDAFLDAFAAALDDPPGSRRRAAADRALDAYRASLEQP
jgi:hypothetical protein